MRTLLLICLFVFGSAAAVTVFAEESAFDELSHAVKKKTVEKLGQPQASFRGTKGNVTGGACKTAADCTPGCAKGKGEASCLNTKEVNACPNGNALPPGGLQCTCLTSEWRCGFATP